MKNTDPEEEIKINLNPENVKILYTDTILMNANDDGVTFDICQKVGISNQVQIVTRVGMSRNHAQKFAKKLSEILALTRGQSQTGSKN